MKNKPVNLYPDDEEHAVFFVHELHDMAEEASLLVFPFHNLSYLFMALGKKESVFVSN